MKPKNPKPTWKARCLELERDKLNLQKLFRQQQTDLDNRPTVEKIVEKEVLPLWHVWFVLVTLAILGGLVSEAWVQVKKLQTPILSPYPVYIITEEENATGHGQPSGTHENVVRAKPRHRKTTDCPSGFEAVGGACAEVNGKQSQEPVKDELGYPKETQ